jgi:hypothetical protein
MRRLVAVRLAAIPCCNLVLCAIAESRPVPLVEHAIAGRLDALARREHR